jgi:hypothetical protein
MKPLTHARHRANLLQQARRLRFEGTRVRDSNAIAISDLRIGVTFNAVSLVESAALWDAERDAYSEWLNYAATILEAGAGGKPIIVGEAQQVRAQLSRASADNDPGGEHGDQTDAVSTAASCVAPRAGDDRR